MDQNQYVSWRFVKFLNNVADASIEYLLEHPKQPNRFCVSASEHGAEITIQRFEDVEGQYRLVRQFRLGITNDNATERYTIQAIENPDKYFLVTHTVAHNLNFFCVVGKQLRSLIQGNWFEIFR